MESFPSNSQRPKPEAKPEREKIKPVVTSAATQRKKPLGKRFAETFVGGDARGTLLYVASEILVPAAKDMMADALTQGFERIIFGESRSGNRRSSRPATNSFVNYSRMSTNNRQPDRRDDREISRRARAGHDFDEIILATRAEGEEVIDSLNELIHQYDVATVADLYDLVGITSAHTDGKWGWDDMAGARVERVRSGGYLLDLPRTKPVD